MQKQVNQLVLLFVWEHVHLVAVSVEEQQDHLKREKSEVADSPRDDGVTEVRV